ncbi:MAG TPA: sigma factor-like helix-turn-helix DNA-binding protein [Ktedonobacteraceae bacterium]|nr:sigma factor-like helix-turn-helix DNA-binding protein [Ktedonobacteraceae bacterium]
MEKDVEQAGKEASPDVSPDAFFAARRVALTRQYDELPVYDSTAFWSLLENGQEGGRMLPLEVLVKVLRAAVFRADEQARRRLFMIIVARLQYANEQWVKQALSCSGLLVGEWRTMAADLYADLCELLLRLLVDPEQRFWEENFQHSLRFARKHVYESFMRREGYWRKLTPGAGKRVPHTLLESLERARRRIGFDTDLDIRDERAEQALVNVEQTDLATLLVHLPVHQRTVVWLIFWEGHTTKTVARLLDISDRTVRNRLRAALAQLREVFEAEQEVIDGASA